MPWCACKHTCVHTCSMCVISVRRCVVCAPADREHLYPLTGVQPPCSHISVRGPGRPERPPSPGPAAPLCRLLSPRRETSSLCSLTELGGGCPGKCYPSQRPCFCGCPPGPGEKVPETRVPLPSHAVLGQTNLGGLVGWEIPCCPLAVGLWPGWDYFPDKRRVPEAAPAAWPPQIHSLERCSPCF